MEHEETQSCGKRAQFRVESEWRKLPRFYNIYKIRRTLDFLDKIQYLEIEGNSSFQKSFIQVL